MLRKLSTLQIALIISVGLHGALLAVRIVDPEGFNRIFQDTPLEVVLVNSRSGQAPDKAQVIAQAALAGGGDAERGRATSPLPPSALVEIGDSDETARKQIEQLLAEIEKRINEENARPKKRYISPAAREEVYALYYDGYRRKVEDRGTRNFPESNGKKLYGELIMNVTIDAAGRVLDTEIVQPSSSKVLDRRAIAIVKAAAPFGPFSAAMRRSADQLVVTSRFKFTRDEALETQQLGPSN